MNLCFTTLLFLYLLSVVVSVSVALDSSESEYIHMETMISRDSVKKRINVKPHPDTMHELTFAIKQSNADKNMHNLLMERSTPGQPLYQQWMSNDEVRALTSNPEASSALLSWFSEHGITVDWVNRGQEYFRVRTHIGTWERLLKTSFHEFHKYDEDSKEHVTAFRAESYSLPASIAVHVSAVFGAVDFPVNPRKVGASFSSPSRPVDNHFSSAQASAITGYVQLIESVVSPNITCNSRSAVAIRAIDYAIGPCIPMSLVTGSNSFRFVPFGSTAVYNLFNDTACTSLLKANQSIPAEGICTVSSLDNNVEETYKVFLSTSSSPPVPTFALIRYTIKQE